MFDYQQIEYRLLAYYMQLATGDSQMVENFKMGVDAHTALAIKLMDVLGVPYTEPITDNQRQVYGKTPNFAIVYAGGKPTIKRQLAKVGIACDDRLARNILKAIRETVPGVRILMDMLAEETEAKKYIFDIFGRHYHPDYKIPYNDAVRKLLNALLQGCAAGLMRQAVVKTAKGCTQLGLQSHMINIVHDELIMDCVEEELPILHEYMPIWMDNATISSVVPVSIDMEVAYESWADKEPYIS